ncbi:hypothetical protein [Streptomyces sp. AC550_RSS872]|uniref:hypothetical protein n=1 Tax=Streptomyces sp. AC550_RSS872 TaxID=2823689 RepID=UPI001C270CE9|nr:hypothetical protein [Streptomyces sp. AC550_RSS872]
MRAPVTPATGKKPLSVGTDLNAVRLRAQGQIFVSGARVPRHLNPAHALVPTPEGGALSADNCTVGEL